MNLQDHPATRSTYKFEADLLVNPSTINFAQAQNECKRTRSGPDAGGHNTTFFLPAAAFHPNGSLLTESRCLDNHVKFLAPVYEADTTLFAGYEKQLSVPGEAFSSNQSTLIGSPIAADLYALRTLQKPLHRGTITVNLSNFIDEDSLVDCGTFSNP